MEVVVDRIEQVDLNIKYFFTNFYVCLGHS